MKIGVRIKEGQKERIQMYQGVIIAINNAGLHKSITVRAVLQVPAPPYPLVHSIEFPGCEETHAHPILHFCYPLPPNTELS